VGPRRREDREGRQRLDQTGRQGSFSDRFRRKTVEVGPRRREQLGRRGSFSDRLQQHVDGEGPESQEQAERANTLDDRLQQNMDRESSQNQGKQSNGTANGSSLTSKEKKTRKPCRKNSSPTASEKHVSFEHSDDVSDRKKKRGEQRSNKTEPTKGQLLSAPASKPRKKKTKANGVEPGDETSKNSRKANSYLNMLD